jgi:hypothetical protein
MHRWGDVPTPPRRAASLGATRAPTGRNGANDVGNPTLRPPHACFRHVEWLLANPPPFPDRPQPVSPPLGALAEAGVWACGDLVSTAAFI